MRMLILLPLPARRVPPITTADPRRPPAEPPSVPTAAPQDAREEPPRSCGWFDSSHELQQGLHSTVHDGSAELATLVPLG